jgi:hypothetical protein
MSKRRYKFTVTNIQELANAYPKAVNSIEIPARTELRPNYAVIAKLLDCDLPVPGIEIEKAVEEEGPEPVDDTPAFLKPKPTLAL